MLGLLGLARCEQCRKIVSRKIMVKHNYNPTRCRPCWVKNIKLHDKQASEGNLLPLDLNAVPASVARVMWEVLELEPFEVEK